MKKITFSLPLFLNDSLIFLYKDILVLSENYHSNGSATEESGSELSHYRRIWFRIVTLVKITVTLVDLIHKGLSY